MPVTITQGNVIAHLGQMTNVQKGAAINAIHQLQYIDIWRNAGTLVQENQMRLDMQGTIAGAGNVPAQQNLQVQTGTHTVAHVNVSHSLQPDDEANRRGALRKVKNALRQSLAGGRSYHVTGELP